MQIAKVKVDQELVYRSRYMGREYGPRIRVTEIQRAGAEESQIVYRDAARRAQSVSRDRVIGVVLDSMGQAWPVDSQFLGLVVDFHLPEDIPEGA